MTYSIARNDAFRCSDITRIIGAVNVAVTLLRQRRADAALQAAAPSDEKRRFHSSERITKKLSNNETVAAQKRF